MKRIRPAAKSAQTQGGTSGSVREGHPRYVPKEGGELSADRVEQGWQVPNQLERAFAVVYEIHEWIGALPISESARYFTYAALEELISNKITHGFPDGGERHVDVRIAFGGTMVRMEFLDDGNEFDPTAHPAPDLERNLDEGIDGGLGIEYVRRICARMEYRREGKRNRVTLHIDVADRENERRTRQERAGTRAIEGGIQARNPAN